MSHYDSLGVQPDATADEIKKAYRAKARQSHPDIGGDAQEFAEIANAYEVLGNPERRLLYDATGRDREGPSIETEVRQVLLNLFSQGLQIDDLETDLITTIRDQVEDVIERRAQEKERLLAAEEKLKARREQISSTAAENLAHMIIDSELQRIAHGIAEQDRLGMIDDALMAELDKYSDFEPPPPKTQVFRVDYGFGGSTGSSTAGW